MASNNSLEEKVFDEIVDDKNDKPPPSEKADPPSKKSEKAKSPSTDSAESSRSSKKKKKKAKSSKGKQKNSDDSKDSSKRKKKSGGSKGKKKRRSKSKSKPKKKSEQASEPISDEFEGESLGECSEKEWEGAEAAYNPTLINLKKKQNRVTVFAATKKVDKKKKTQPGDPIPPNEKEPSTTLVAVGSDVLPQPVAPQKPEDHADMIGKLVAGVVRKYLEGKADDDVRVEIKLTCGDGTVTPVLP